MPGGEGLQLVFTHDPNQGPAGEIPLQRFNRHPGGVGMAALREGDLSVVGHHAGVLEAFERQAHHLETLRGAGHCGLVYGGGGDEPAHFREAQLVGRGLGHGHVGAVHGVEPATEEPERGERWRRGEWISDRHRTWPSRPLGQAHHTRRQAQCHADHHGADHAHLELQHEQDGHHRDDRGHDVQASPGDDS